VISEAIGVAGIRTVDTSDSQSGAPRRKASSESSSCGIEITPEVTGWSD